MDPRITVVEQLQHGSIAPVVLINEFTVDPEQSESLIDAWAEDAGYFKGQPGFISAQLHRGIAGSGVFLNYAVWESVSDFRRAFSNPEFRAKLDRYPSSTVAAPHLFQKVAVAGICLGC
jgi:heme-degrading monooxygenase HmoA